MSLLTIAQRAANKIGVPRITSVVGSTDPVARLMLECANEEGADLATEWQWQKLRTTREFVATATTIQAGALPADFDRMVPDTFYNHATGRFVVGPIGSARWQAHMASVATIVYDAYRINGGNIEMIPTPVAGTTYAFEYVGLNWVQDQAGVNRYSEWQADTDTALLSEDLIRLGVVWRFKQSRGLDYAEDMRTYERAKVKAQAADGAKGTISLSGTGPDGGPRYPAIPEGNWTV